MTSFISTGSGEAGCQLAQRLVTIYIYRLARPKKSISLKELEACGDSESIFLMNYSYFSTNCFILP